MDWEGLCIIDQRCEEHLENLRSLIRGEWVDCDKVCQAMNIEFKEGMHLFEFGRQAFWNPAPLNGQYVVTKFRLSDKTLQNDKPFITEKEEEELKRRGCW